MHESVTIRLLFWQAYISMYFICRKKKVTQLKINIRKVQIKVHHKQNWNITSQKLKKTTTTAVIQ